MKLLFLPLLFVSTLNATYTFSVSFGSLYGDSVGADVPVQVTAAGAGQGAGGTIGVILVDTSNGSGGAFPQADALFGKSLTQYANWGSNFYVANLMTAINVNVTNETTSPAALFNGALAPVDPTLMPGASTSGGNPFAIYWFPSITDTNTVTNFTTGITPSVATIPADTKYGFFTSSTALHTGLVSTNHAFVTPANGVTNFVVQSKNEDAINDASEVTAGTFPANNLFLADRTVVGAVPEPSTYALMGLGLVVVGLVARRKKA